MKSPQAGIFALGTASHAYLEFDALDQRHGEKLAAAIAGQQIAAGDLKTQIGRVFAFDQIVEAHRVMEENKAGGKIVVLVG